MINIRYHIVSITAVFLALGIGVALGSTFLDKATVNVLDRNITSAERRIRETNAENDRLNQQLEDSKERDTSLIVVGSESLLADQLTDVPVLVIAAPGVGKNDLEPLQTILARSGADFRGTVELSDKLAFDGDVDTALAADLGLSDVDAGGLRTAATNRVTAALAGAGTPVPADGEGEGTTTTSTTTSTTLPAGGTVVRPVVPDGTQPAAVTALIDRGYLKVDPGPAYTADDPILETTGYRYVYVGAPDLDADQNDVLLALLPSSGDALPATVISASQPAPTLDEVLDPTVVARVRASDALRERYNTVDNTQTFAGLVATVFTLQGMGEVDPGQYGQADGATAVLPPPS